MSTPVSIREVMPCRIQLPFMPDRINYKIGKGCCNEILFCSGLFVPCSKHCEDGVKCSTHLKKPSKYGTYEERYKAWENHEPYCVYLKEKAVREKPYCAHLNAIGENYLTINEELKRWGIPLEFNAVQWRMKNRPEPVPKPKPKPKKILGTPLDPPVSL
jgi:hypothetical protein